MSILFYLDTLLRSLVVRLAVCLISTQSTYQSVFIFSGVVSAHQFILNLYLYYSYIVTMMMRENFLILQHEILVESWFHL